MLKKISVITLMFVSSSLFAQDYKGSKGCFKVLSKNILGIKKICFTEPKNPGKPYSVELLNEKGAIKSNAYANFYPSDAAVMFPFGLDFYFNDSYNKAKAGEVVAINMEPVDINNKAATKTKIALGVKGNKARLLSSATGFIPQVEEHSNTLVAVNDIEKLTRMPASANTNDIIWGTEYILEVEFEGLNK